MRKSILVGMLAAVALIVTICGFGAFSPFSGGWGMMHGHGPGYGLVAAPGWTAGQASPTLSAGDVGKYFERSILRLGNSRLKVGALAEKDADTIIVDIVTLDNSLVQRFVVNRHSGVFRPTED